MSNDCFECIGKNGNDCCIDVYIILNPEEIILFKNHKEEFIEVENGGIFYTKKGCPYFTDNLCQIHLQKPLYCRFYPIFITGKPFIHQECSIHNNYTLSDAIKQEIDEIQRTYPIYQHDWYWEDVRREFQDKLI
ncbi:MAG: YkgJ family cysteine cluster protein [Candidatus Thorarchaeota archaeon]